MRNHKIHRNNYDLTFKYIAEWFKDDFLSALGILSVGNVIELIPTNIISIETSDLEVDFLCLLEDETYLHLEFQTITSVGKYGRSVGVSWILEKKYTQ